MEISRRDQRKAIDKAGVCEKLKAEERSRTANLSLTKRLLCQLSYLGKNFSQEKFFLFHAPMRSCEKFSMVHVSMNGKDKQPKMELGQILPLSCFHASCKIIQLHFSNDRLI